MRIFLAGATGVLGQRLIPRLLERGHNVIGTSSKYENLKKLERRDVQAVLMNGLDRDSVIKAVTSTRPDVIVNEMTALSHVRNYKDFDAEFAVTNRLRKEGTAYLMDAAKESGTKKIVVQSFAGWPWSRENAHANSEDAAFEDHLPDRMRQSQNAIREMEAAVLTSSSPEGIVLRYGFFYGEGTSMGPDGDVAKTVRKRGFPLLGNASGLWSFIHVEDAAEATRIAIESAPAGIYNIVDDRPAAVSEWLPELARLLNAKKPMNLPAWLGKLFVGEPGLYLMTQTVGASNAKAKNVLGWKPRFSDWHAGFSATLASHLQHGAQ